MNININDIKLFAGIVGTYENTAMSLEEWHGSTHLVKLRNGKTTVFNYDALQSEGCATIYEDGKKAGVIKFDTKRERDMQVLISDKIPAKTLSGQSNAKISRAIKDIIYHKMR